MGAKEMGRLLEQKKKEMCLRSSTATLCVLQLNPKTLLLDTAQSASVEDVINEGQCVLAVLGSDCRMLKSSKMRQ